MRIPSSAFILILVAGGAGGWAQAPVTTAAVQATTPAAQAAAPAVVTASSLLQPALTRTQTTLGSLRVDKWKKGSVREEAEQNVASLLHDLQANIPPLLTAADAEPGALSRWIPLLKHLDAFYDVLLRVEEASRVSAPGEQITALQQTLLDVNKARMAMDDQMTAEAANQEKQAFTMRQELRAKAEAPRTASETASTAPCKPATPTRKRRRTTSSSHSTTAKPSAGKPAQPEQ